MVRCLSQLWARGVPRYDDRMQHVRQRPAETQSRLLSRVDDLARAGRVRKGSGTVPDHIVLEEPPELPDPQGVLAQLLEDRERGW